MQGYGLEVIPGESIKQGHFRNGSIVMRKPFSSHITKTDNHIRQDEKDVFKDKSAHFSSEHNKYGKYTNSFDKGFSIVSQEHNYSVKFKN